MDDKANAADQGAGWEPLPEEPEAPGRALGPRLLVAGLALVAAAVFVAQNSDPVPTTFLFFSGRPRLWAVIAFSLVLGALLGQAIPFLYSHRKSRKGKDKD